MKAKTSLETDRNNNDLFCVSFYMRPIWVAYMDRLLEVLEETTVEVFSTRTEMMRHALKVGLRTLELRLKERTGIDFNAVVDNKDVAYGEDIKAAADKLMATKGKKKHGRPIRPLKPSKTRLTKQKQ